MSYSNTTRKKQEKISYRPQLRYWLPWRTPEKFMERNEHLWRTMAECIEYCDKNERKAKSLRDATYRADHTRENNRDTTDEEDEHKVITNDDMIDAWYTPKPKYFRDRHEDHMEEIHDAYDREREDNPQAR